MDQSNGSDQNDANRRREQRFPVDAEAILERGNGEQIQASTVNVSGSGVLLQTPENLTLAVGEQVQCGIKLYEGKPPQSWGHGKVIRVENSRVAIEFKGA
jgi:hypothetical protein